MTCVHLTISSLVLPKKKKHDGVSRGLSLGVGGNLAFALAGTRTKKIAMSKELLRGKESPIHPIISCGKENRRGQPN